MKKMKTTLLAIVCALTLATAAESQTVPGFELGLDVSKYGYRERIDGDVVATDDGRFAGLSAGYTKTFANRLFVRSRLSVDVGSVDYRSDDGETRLDDVDQGIGRLELHAGRDFLLHNGTTLSPFVGLGVRVLDDESGGRETENGFAGYDRTIAYRYVPVGLAATFGLRGASTLTLSGQYNRLIGGRAKSELSDVDSELPNITIGLNGGSGYELSAMFALPLGGHRLSVGPFIRSWSIHQSKSFELTDPEGSGETVELFEPANRTRETGVRLAFTF